MSDLNGLLQKAKDDEGLRTKLTEAGSAAEIVAVGAEAGFSFTEADVDAAHKEKMSSGEVSQEDLDNVSGGTIISPVIMITITVCGR